MIRDPKAFLRSLFDSAVAAAQPAHVMAGAMAGLVTDPMVAAARGRTVVVGGGKGAAAMAAAFEDAWPRPCGGLVVTRDGYRCPTRWIEVAEAGHPTPDHRGVVAAGRMLALAAAAGPDDVVVCLISGGASALMPVPRPGLTLEDKRQMAGELMRRGAKIEEINVVRKHLSAIKGGQLALIAAPATVRTLIISDVVGDDVATIGSGPTAPDPSTCADAMDILARYGVIMSPVVHDALHKSLWETPKALPANVTNTIVARPRDALSAAAAAARQNGVDVLELGDRFDLDASVVAHQHVAEILKLMRTWTAPVVVLSGGEVTVDVNGRGVGGPNTQFAVALAVELERANMRDVWFLAADTDGTDGVGGHAGALCDPGMLARAGDLGLTPGSAIQNNDTATFLARTGNLLVTGPTYTNVNDFRAILVVP